MSDLDMKELIFSAVDMLWFVFAISTIIFCLAQGRKINIAINEDVTKNATVTAKMDTSIYNGYTDDGDMKYDGQLSGAEVIEEILNGQNTYTYYVIQMSGNKINLSSQRKNDMPLIDYAKDWDQTALSGLFNVNATYIREYKTDTNGNIEAVLYKYKE